MTLLESPPLSPSEVMTPDELVAAFAAHERNAVELALAVARVEAAGAWAAEGAVSFLAFLRHRCRLSGSEAQRWHRRGQVLTEVDELADLARRRVLSLGQLDAWVSVARDAVSVQVLHEQAPEVLPLVEHLSVTDTVAVARMWRQRVDALIEQREPQLAVNEITIARTDDGTGVGRFVLQPDIAEVLERAVDLAATWDGAADTRTRGERRADGLGEVCSFFLAHHDRAGTPRHRPHVELVVEATELTGLPVTGSLAARLAGCGTISDTRPRHRADVETWLCDCVLHRVLTAGSAVLDYGRGTHSVPRHLFRAVALRDRGCRYPGCDRPVSFTDAHHIVHWVDGGPTSLDNLTLLCRRHHRRVHQHHEQLGLASDGTLTVVDATGDVRISRPRPRSLAPPGVAPPV